MSEDWGPWIEHDGRGCPSACFGRFIQIEMKLARADNEGGQPGQISYNEMFVCEAISRLPEWDDANFGRIVLCAIRPGEAYACCKVIRYRIRKPRALQQLRELVENLPAPQRQPDREDA